MKHMKNKNLVQYHRGLSSLLIQIINVGKAKMININKCVDQVLISFLKAMFWRHPQLASYNIFLKAFKGNRVYFLIVKITEGYAIFNFWRVLGILYRIPLVPLPGGLIDYGMVCGYT